MQYSPKLKKAMEEIKKILDEHDIAGSVVLHTPGFAEHYLKVDPTYSCAYFEPLTGEEGVALRVRSRLQADYNGDSAKKAQTEEDTINMFVLLADMLGMQTMQVMEMVKLLETKFDINRTGGNHTDNRTIQN